MLTEQKNYDFKKELLIVHTPNLRNLSLLPDSDELDLSNGVKILIENPENAVIMTAARDFTDYLFTSQLCSATLVRNGNADITVKFGKNLGDAEGYMGYRITVNKNGVLIEGHDERGIAQAFYYIEDLMNIRKAPFLKFGVTARKALFSPRITQSPFGMFEWCDEAFQILAHRGFDAIDLWIRDPYTNNRGDYIDIRLIAERAAKYGIDVYVELYASHHVHPDDDGAEKFYDKLYGTLFEVCPLIKGITVVGEATNFASRDPNVGLSPYAKNFIDNIPTGKTSPGWYPCCDYPAWITMIKNAVRKRRPDAEILFCTYNWGDAPEEKRVELINNLPTDISLLATWDMFEQYKVGNSVEDICDYSLAFEGPGKYFISEATAAKKRGIKICSIANTSGRTWDFGTVPYEPMPEQWIKRYKNIQKAHEELGLRGIVENIHYGFHPSIITDLEKQAFFTPVEPLEDTLMKLLERDFGKENASSVKQATENFSQAIRHYIPTNEDQYGGFRTGPAYPLWSGVMEGLPSTIPEQGKMPSRPHAMFGNGVYFGVYTPESEGRNSLPGVRIYDELEAVKKVESYMQKGIDILEKISAPNDNLLRFILLAKFIRNHCRTVINVKKHYILKQKLSIAGTIDNAKEIIDALEKVTLEEKANVLDTIPIVKLDSRLGWEPSMDYTTDEKGLKWKLRQLDFELTVKIPKYRLANSLKID
ncbi:MAG: hypothetical protein IKA11_01225 [Clostridia bacterium]|nr:hypothetical protein [Clostridia bacterium]